jgi:malate dehydrogenase (oxaloacetate-decarboxylating)(NADP+)
MIVPMNQSNSGSPSAFQLLFDARLNKGAAFSESEREQFGLVGLIPDGIESMDIQLDRARLQFEQQSSDLGKYQFLSALQDRQERLFYALLRSDFQRYMPIVYTPTVGEACQKFGHIMRRPKGMYLSMNRRGKLAQVLRNWPVKDVRFIVVTDGERILGLGDQGVCGMGIPIGKLALYTACAGVPPQVALPVVLDMGTNNEGFRNDPLYPGLRVPRIGGDEYLSFIDEFVAAVQEVFPRCCIQFEDFTNKNAIPLLERYRDKVCCFNDDIQGTASVAVAGLFGACRMNATKMSDQRILFMGAGSAAVGIADLFVKQLCGDGMSEAQALERCWFVNSRGMVHSGMPKLPDYLQRYAHDVSGLKFPVGAPSGLDSPLTRLSDVVEVVRPTAIIGVSTVAHAFNETVVRAMARINARPIIFPLSNPTSKSECTAEEAIRWSEGRAIIATGSPFPPMHFGGKLFVPGQGNNVYIYPAVGMAVFATEANRVTDEMFLRAAESLASQTTDQDLSVGLIYPPISSIYETSIEVAIAVAALIFDQGLARVPRPADIAEFVRERVYDPAF